ncbi:MAG: hypothetical protein ABUL60_00010 [Myxococcales bacterium]
MNSSKRRARSPRWLATFCVGASLVALTVAACSVPEFEFPPPPVEQGMAGETGVIPNPPDPCTNKQLDADSGETDFDCGGGCEPCGVGQHCVDGPDCQADLLCHEGTCIGLGCMNEAQDGNETDVDCGGDGCKPCISGQSCAVETDCESGVCGDAKCLAPACDDQVKNGKETGADCGGDCSPCPENEPCVLGKDCISGECNDKICGSECQDGFANCDQKNDNACEINTRTDLDNCGFCGNACDLPNATAECSAGECHIKTDGCAPGFQDCNGKPEDGCEVDLKTNKLNCGTCNKICPDLNGTPSCVAGLCEIACNDGFQDCDDTRDNGCEINTNTSSKNCGMCDKKCAAAVGYSAYCKDAVCGQTMCPAGKGDCNGDQSDNCEINLTNDVNNCGDCGHVCEANNAKVACVNSQCVITSCVGTYADCNKATVDGFKDGCEVDTSVNTSNCGACGKACSIANGTPKCQAGSCEVNSCSGTFRDCDGDPKTGCEINIATNTKNCGGCGNQGSDCSLKYANASSSCVGSACTTPVCNNGYGDCAGGLTDGCESNTTNDPDNCGGCGLGCSTGSSAHVSTNACSNSQCNPVCAGTYLTCDNDKRNGCEVDSATNANNCSACGIVCSTAASAHVTSNPCVGSSCAPQCAGTYDDCDTSRVNGCEVDTATSASNCGSCGTVCSTAAGAHVTANPCSGSTCHPACSGLYDDCDSSRTNGCEKDVSADINNCGACGAVCGKLHASGGTSCASGSCSPACDTGWAKCTASDKTGCATQLGTTSNCSKCDEACSGGTPFCDPAGCVDHRDIVVVNSGSGAPTATNQWHAVAGWNGSANVPVEIKLSHTLQTAKGNNRMVLVGVAYTDTILTASPTVGVTYDGQPMQLATQQVDVKAQSYAGVFYILDAALPTTTGAKDVIATYTTPGNRWGHAGLDLMELKNTMQVAPIATGGSIITPTDPGCSGGSTRTATVTFSQVGSLVYGVLGARGATAATLSGASGLVETWNQLQSSPDKMIGAAAYVFDNDNRTITWNVVNCYNSATAAVAIKRLNWN